MFWFLLILFVVGVVGASLVITRKIPMVLATPRQVIDDYFDQGSARLHVRVLRIKAWIKEGEYWDPIFYISLRALRWVRIGLLRLERVLFNLIQFLNARYEAHKNGTTHEHEPVAEETHPGSEYWDELKNKNEAPK